MLTGLFLSMALWCGAAHATSVVALDVAEQAADSTAVVDAVVGEPVQVEDGGELYTDTPLVVNRVLAGRAPVAVDVRQIKGTKPSGARFFVIGDAELTEGERVVAFLRRDADGHWYLTALNQSVWHVDAQGADPAVDRSFEGLELYQRTMRGVVPATQSPAAFDRLSDLEAAVEGLPTLEVTRCARSSS